MLVEIWSDVMCPFCYLGKRRFADALAHFPHREEVKVQWRSFQLNPALRSDTPISVNEYLAREKGIDPRQAAQMHERLTRLGHQAGIEYDFDRAVVANTFDAHRLVHFAREYGREDELVERLFVAYFTEGRNVGDRPTLVALAQDLAIDAGATKQMLDSDRYADAVRSDIREAAQLGIDGVPFFDFDRKYAVSGAQEMSTFASALEQSYAERTRIASTA
jgi:predicted DsbA family dithiol-disulfide isomerase